MVPDLLRSLPRDELAREVSAALRPGDVPSGRTGTVQGVKTTDAKIGRRLAAGIKAAHCTSFDALAVGGGAGDDDGGPECLRDTGWDSLEGAADTSEDWVSPRHALCAPRSVSPPPYPRSPLLWLHERRMSTRPRAARLCAVRASSDSAFVVQGGTVGARGMLLWIHAPLWARASARGLPHRQQKSVRRRHPAAPYWPSSPALSSAPVRTM